MDELEQLRARAGKWTLADDSKLITCVSSLVDSMLDRGRSIDASLVSTSSAISHLHSSIDTAESAIGLYSSTQFIEQRVMDDDYRPPRPSQPVPAISLEQRQAIILADIRAAMRDGLQMIDDSFRKLGDESDPFVQYEPIDRYNSWIPPIIGTAAFRAMGKRKKETVKDPISITVDQSKSVAEPSSTPVQPSPTSSPSNAFVGISAFPPISSAPPPPPPPMPSKASPLAPTADRSSLQAEITSFLAGNKGEFRVPHDEGPQDVDAGLTPPLPPRSPLHLLTPKPAPVLPPRGSVLHTEPPQIPPKRDEKISTSIPLPAEPIKKSIFDFDSDDDDFAAVLSRPSKKQASSSTLSSSMRSNESDTKSLKSQEERKEQVKNQGPSSLASELAAAAASKRAQQLAGTASTAPSHPVLPSETNKTSLESATTATNPLSAPIVKKEEKKEESKPAVKKQAWAPPKKSIFDDEDSDFDDLFKPPQKKKEEVKKIEVKKIEEKKVEEQMTVQPTKKAVAPAKDQEKTKRRNLFDSDSDLEDFLKPKASLAKQIPPPKQGEAPKVEKPAENPIEEKEEKKDEREEEKKEAAALLPVAAEQPVILPQNPPETSKPDPITVRPVVKEDEKEEEEKSEKKEGIPVDHYFESTANTQEEKEEQPLPLREEKAFSPVRESPPPFDSPIIQSKSVSEKPVSTPQEVKAATTPAPVKKELSLHFDSPPPFNQPEEEPSEEEDQRISSATEDSDTEAMQGNRAAFMAQLNAKLASKSPSGMGIRPMSMIETSSASFVPPLIDRSSVAPSVKRASSEEKSDGPLSHANKSRPRGPIRRPPTTAKRITSSSESEDTTKPSTRSTVTREKQEVPRSLPPKSPISTSPMKESPVIFRKTSDPKSPPVSISRKSSSSSSLGADGDPLSALSAVHTSPYKPPSTAFKPPTSPMSRMSVATMSTMKNESMAQSTSKSTDSKPKKSIFDSDSDDFYEKFGGSKTLPSKSSAFKSELESTLKKDKKAPASSQKKGIFDDSDEDLDMFRKKK